MIVKNPYQAAGKPVGCWLAIVEEFSSKLLKNKFNRYLLQQDSNAELPRDESDPLTTCGSRCLTSSHIFPSVDISIPGSKAQRTLKTPGGKTTRKERTMNQIRLQVTRRNRFVVQVN